MGWGGFSGGGSIPLNSINSKLAIKVDGENKIKN